MSDYQAAMAEYIRCDDEYTVLSAMNSAAGDANARADAMARFHAAKEARFVALNKLLSIKPPKPEQEAKP